MKIIHEKNGLIHFIFLLVVAIFWSCKDSNEPESALENSTISLETNYLDFPVEGGEDEIGLHADTDWKVITASEPWLEVTPKEGKKGKSLTLVIRISKNEEDNERKAKIIVKAITGTAADTLTIRQGGNSRYVPINWEKDAKLMQFNLMDGNVKIEFSDEVPSFTPYVSSIVVPADTLSYIRVVTAVSVNGNSVTLQTIEGDMTDLFMDQEFTLSTVPATKTYITRSGQVCTTDKEGGIHPTRIKMVMEDGRQEVLYDINKEIAARVMVKDTVHDVNFYYWEKDFTGEMLYNKGGVTLQWDKCLFRASIDGKFYFNFGSTVEIGSTGIRVPKGELYGFFYILEGSMDFDFLLHLMAKSKHKYESEEPVVLIKQPQKLVFEFIVSSVPVYVTVDSSIKAEIFAESKSRGDVSGGFNAGISLKAGVEYFKDNGVKPIEPILTPYFNLYKPEIKVKGKAEASLTLFPDINISLYNFAGFDIQFKPTIGDEITYGGVAGGTNENYMAWTNRLYQQFDVWGNLSFGFIGDPWKSPSIRLGGTEQKDLIRSPDQIEFITSDDMEIKKGETVAVQVRVSDFIAFGGTSGTKGAVVKFGVVNGKIDNENAITDAYGLATVNYTPTAANSVLTAKILNADGESIDVATFKPNIKKKEFDIVGTWRHRTEQIVIDKNGNTIEKVYWYDKLICYENGQYFYEHNPDKKTLQFTDSQGGAHTSLSYGYNSGNYIFSEDPLQITLSAGPVTDESTSNGYPIPGHISHFNYVFGKSGTYEIIRGMNDDGTLNNSVFGIGFIDDWGRKSSFVFEKESDFRDGINRTVKSLKSTIPPHMQIYTIEDFQ